MDALLRQWQAERLPKRKSLPDRRPTGPERYARRGRPPAAHMSRHQDDLAVIDAGPVTIVGTPAEVDSLARAAGLYAPEGNGPPMSRDEEDHIMTGVYVGVGLLLAAGAGYLAWRYLLDDTQKERIVNKSKDLVADGLTKGKRAVRDARSHIPL